MASNAEQKLSAIIKPTFDSSSIHSSDYCSDCLYYWCKERSNVTFCTMKFKGLFECKSCMLKLIEGYK